MVFFAFAAVARHLILIWQDHLPFFTPYAEIQQSILEYYVSELTGLPAVVFDIHSHPYVTISSYDKDIK